MTDPSGSTVWTNWAGLEEARPRDTEAPRDVGQVAAAVRRARDAGTTVKMVGSGHSFTAIGRPEHTMLRPDRLTGVLAVDRDAMTVTALAGTPLKVLNHQLERLGLSLHNMGDIAEQTLAGAVSTGTHGTGGAAAGLAAQVVGLEMVTGAGEVLSLTDADPELALARVGLGALGILTSLTFKVEPLFLLRADERPVGWAELLATHDELVDTHDHVDVHWFPHTDRALLKANTRLAEGVDDREPLPRLRGWVDDELLANTVLGAVTATSARVPRLTGTLNRLTVRALSSRTYSDLAHRVFVSARSVRFREMEYAVPRAAGLAVLREARRVIEARRLHAGFPVEVRTAPADDVALSTSYGRDTTYLAFHVHHRTDHREYFRAMEEVLRAHDGRPHWGKLHSLTAAALEPRYPRFAEFLALRDRLDPDRVLVNDHLRRVLGA